MHGGAGKGAHGVVVFMGRLVREKRVRGKAVECLSRVGLPSLEE